MMLLGFCTISGGMSTSMSALAADSTDSNQKSYYMAVNINLSIFSSSSHIVTQLNVGYGFASFFFILAFILLLAASIYLSPPSCGSENEKRTIKDPMELPHHSSGPSAPIVAKEEI